MLDRSTVLDSSYHPVPPVLAFVIFRRIPHLTDQRRRIFYGESSPVQLVGVPILSVQDCAVNHDLKARVVLAIRRDGIDNLHHRFRRGRGRRGRFRRQSRQRFRRGIWRVGSKGFRGRIWRRGGSVGQQRLERRVRSVGLEEVQAWPAGPV